MIQYILHIIEFLIYLILCLKILKGYTFLKKGDGFLFIDKGNGILEKFLSCLIDIDCIAGLY